MAELYYIQLQKRFPHLPEGCTVISMVPKEGVSPGDPGLLMELMDYKRKFDRLMLSKGFQRTSYVPFLLVDLYIRAYRLFTGAGGTRTTSIKEGLKEDENGHESPPQGPTTGP